MGKRKKNSKRSPKKEKNTKRSPKMRKIEKAQSYKLYFGLDYKGPHF